jgi:excisionase family DNA binding protein
MSHTATWNRAAARSAEPVAEDEILTAREAQALLKIGRTKLWDLTRRNAIPAYRVGPGNRSSLRYKRTELLSWLEGNRVRGEGL